ncbi:MAG: hypothetical protein ABI051_19025 [Vicinamibacterales bacterium]
MSESSYSPRLRTGVILCGAGTAGAYQAGALRAIIEAGIKIDVIGAHGAGVATALAAAIDGGARVWDEKGPWSAPGLRHAYRWRTGLRVAFIGLAASAVVLLSPILVLVLAAVAYAAAFVTALVSLTALSAWCISLYRATIDGLFDPPILPTVIPRLLVLAVLIVVAVLIVSGVRALRQERSRRRVLGAFWWRLVAFPIDATEPVASFVEMVWTMVRGASHEPRPAAAEIGRRYVDVLADNFGQPGFHEIILAVHDLDARRDLVGAVLAAPSRSAFDVRHQGPGPREAEIVDFTGPQRALLMDFLAGALRLPVVMAPALVEFPADSYWRGERHRVCDRPELVARLIDELAGIGVEQVILVSPAPPPAVPHAMRAHPIDLRARMGEMIRSMETAALADGATAALSRFSGVFVVRPDHNPIGPFDFVGTYDEASDRQRTIAELMHQGYADAYRHFIEPVVAAGDRLEVL